MGAVLVILPPAIGDIMMAVPLLRTLHVAGWRVDTVIDEGFAGLEAAYAHHVRHQHMVPVKIWRKRSLLYDIPGRLGLVARIRKERYDALIQVGTGSLGIWLTWAARIPVSIAQDVHHKVAVKRWAYHAIITHRVPVDDHAAAENVAFASALGIAPVTNYPEVRGSASSRTVVIAPDATQSGRAIPLSEVTRIIRWSQGRLSRYDDYLDRDQGRYRRAGSHRARTGDRSHQLRPQGRRGGRQIGGVRDRVRVRYRACGGHLWCPRYFRVWAKRPGQGSALGRLRAGCRRAQPPSLPAMPRQRMPKLRRIRLPEIAPYWRHRSARYGFPDGASVIRPVTRPLGSLRRA